MLLGHAQAEVVNWAVAGVCRWEERLDTNGVSDCVLSLRAIKPP